MNASPQPSVVPRTGTASTGTKSVAAAVGPAVEHAHALRPEGHDDEPAQAVRDRTDPVDRRVLEPARPAHEPDVDVGHGVGEALDGVVAEAEEVGRDLDAARRSGLGQAPELADRALDEDEVDGARRSDQRLLVGPEPQGRPDALHVVVHPGLEVGLDDDVDGRRSAGRDEAGLGRDAVAVEEGAEHLRPVVADSRQQPERDPGPPPSPGHVEHAAARQDEVAAEVDVEADGAEEDVRSV